jgi:glycosyltransferase involved in cell wall biosynthesis
MTRQYLAAGIGHPDQYTRIVSGFNLTPFLATDDPPLTGPSTRAQLGLAPGDLVVGKVARLVPLKGHDELVAAAPDILRILPQPPIPPRRRRPARPALEAAIARTNLGRHFVFTGLVPPDRDPRLRRVMDMLVHLSRREGLARALPQALAAGRPVVAYDCDGANEVCLNGRTGYLIPVGNQAALRERIRILAADPRLRQVRQARPRIGPGQLLGRTHDRRPRGPLPPTRPRPPPRHLPRSHPNPDAT